jgi:AraC family transcriptional regulator
LFVQEKETFVGFLQRLSAQVTVIDGLNRFVATGQYSGIEPGRQEVGLTQHLLSVTEKYPTHWHDGRSLHAKQPGALTFLPAGFISQMRALTPFTFLVCAFDPLLLRTVESELDHSPSGDLPPQVNFQDVSLRHLVMLLHTETTEDGRWERLYREHLMQAIALRVLSLKGAVTAATSAMSPLPYRALRRVLERMNELGDDLSIKDLAKESGYSRNHFSRMFQAATGRTPHSYLTHLRLERAQELIRNHRGSLSDIASACGFSSHSHMALAFRKILGVTPSEYQRHVSGRNG